jgi:hypothetical protein
MHIWLKTIRILPIIFVQESTNSDIGLNSFLKILLLKRFNDASNSCHR